MKKVLFVLAVAGFFAACGSKATETSTETAVEETQVEETQVETVTEESPAETAIQ